MAVIKRVKNIAKYGFGPKAREKKRADKARARAAKFESERWQKGEAMAQRRYGSYEEYLKHQAEKLGRIEESLEKTLEEDFQDFVARFRGCEALKGERTVLCLGARLGTEVRALHSLGYFAVGIDLNPGETNPYVLYGDFHDVVFPDGSLDAIYSNALDHIFDLDKIVGEVVRMLRPGGIFIVDLVPGYDEGFVPGNYEATAWATAGDFLDRICEVGGLVNEGLRDLGQIRSNQWMQATLRKPLG